MNDLNLIQERLKECVGKFLLSLQTTRVVDRETFAEIDRQCRLLARALKGHELLPRAALNELHVATKIIRAEAPYIKNETSALVEMANQLEYTLSLILLSECHDDYVPGVPRVI
jgi:hypothetical protein